jgi:hypothetical protein
MPIWGSCKQVEGLGCWNSFHKRVQAYREDFRNVDCSCRRRDPVTVNTVQPRQGRVKIARQELPGMPEKDEGQSR